MNRCSVTAVFEPEIRLQRNLLDQQPVQKCLGASPIYDWSTSDVWHANYTFQYDYNRLYDLYYMAGLKPDQMRVASPFNDYAKDSLNLYRVIDPQIWVKLIGRVRGANFGAIYGRTKAMGYKNITLPAGHTWESYTRFLLATLPARLRQSYIKKFKTSIEFWHTVGGGLEEETIRELEEHGYNIRRNGVSNYTVMKNSRIVLSAKYLTIPTISNLPKISPAGSGCASAS